MKVLSQTLLKFAFETAPLFKQDKAPSYSWHITSHGNAEREQKSEVFQGIFKNVLLAPFMGRGLSAFADN